MSDTHAQTVRFVRDTMLPAATAPVGERGAVKWLRENLFAGPWNSALTILAIFVLYQALSSIIPWLLNSMWNAGSLSECREILAAKGDTSGACWGVIRTRWHQYMFGFYPPDLYWRPLLAFGLLFIALSPVLYYGSRQAATAIAGAATAFVLLALLGLGEGAGRLAVVGGVLLALTALAWVAPKKLVWVTALYAPVCFLLLWGGSVWSPVVALLGFGLIVAAYIWGQGVLGTVGSVGAGIVLAVLFWIYIDVPLAIALSAVVPIGLQPVASNEFGGFLLAIIIGVTAISFSLPLGILLALGRQSNLFIVKTLSVGFIEFIRGVPLITLLFTASLLLQYFLPPGTNFDIILRVIILVTFFAAAYLAEVIRGGLAALPRGQYEAADALGLDYWQAQRLIILPQALKISIPGIVSTFIGLFKDTTLVSFVGLMDPLRGVTQIVRADLDWKGIYWEPYVFVGALFFVMCYGMSQYSQYLERKLRTDHR
ncbi:MAG: amino acid ABC transporter permease [Rhodobacteraceae bacterium]|jgi:general L-amino acid transport system permease protein|nr:amino acid ABC transporter permease [Paracoccaceae bacterium]